MTNKVFFNKLERGQIIPIVVFALIAMIGLSALIIDGGALMVNRRAAQNAADAGALAGARVLCGAGNPTSTDVYNAVYQYTTEENNAELFDWYITTENVGEATGLVRGEVVVTAEISHDSFFARIFTDEPPIAQATAGAGCAPYGPKVIIPIIYPCNTALPDSDNPDCDYKMLEKNAVLNIINAASCGVQIPLEGNQKLTKLQADCISDALYEVYSEYIYIVVNSDKYCADEPKELDPTNEIICELSDTGRYQLNSSARGWLNLTSGDGSTASLTNWINGTVKVTSSVHTWHSIIPGRKQGNQLWEALENRRGHIVWVPIINKICDDNPNNKPSCFEDAHEDFPLLEGQTCNVVAGNPGQEFGHIVAFAPFIPTCVRRHNSNDECPGYDRAVVINPSLGDNPKPASVEGYFLFPNFLIGDSASIGGADLGIYRAFLTR